MRRLLLAMLLIASPALGAEPKVVVNGPHAAVAGTILFLDVSDSVSDPETPLVVGVDEISQGAKPAVKLLKDEGVATIARVLPTEPGAYNLVFAATGKPDEKSAPVTVYRVWPIKVTKAPAPDDDPAPDPDEPSPDPQTLGAKLGKAFGPKLAASLAEAFETAATMISAGTSVTEADNQLKEKFQAGRNAAFAQFVAPTFAAVVPDGQEPKDAATRAAFAELHREFAKGLRGAR